MAHGELLSSTSFTAFGFSFWHCPTYDYGLRLRVTFYVRNLSYHVLYNGVCLAVLYYKILCNTIYTDLYHAVCTSGVLVFQRRIVSDKRYSDRRLDVLSSIVLAETALNGPNTKERKLIIDLAICMATRMVRDRQ